MWRAVPQAPRNSLEEKRKSRIQAIKVRIQATWFLNKTNTGIQLTLCRVGVEVL